MKPQYYKANHKVSETGNKNLFVALGDLVYIEKEENNLITFNFRISHHNITGQSMVLPKDKFFNHFSYFGSLENKPSLIGLLLGQW